MGFVLNALFITGVSVGGSFRALLLQEDPGQAAPALPMRSAHPGPAESQTRKVGPATVLTRALGVYDNLQV